PVASCADIAQRELDVIGLAGDVADALACAISRFRLDPTLDPVIDEYARVSYSYGRAVRIADAVFLSDDATGSAIEKVHKADIIIGIERGIDSLGRLALETDDEQRLRIISGTLRPTE
ncbi:MAG: hypothetical protein ABIH86_07135, partial [Planctomycetota bacterium]